MPIANSIVLVYRKVLLHPIKWQGCASKVTLDWPGQSGRGIYFDERRPEFRIRAGLSANQPAGSKEARLC